MMPSFLEQCLELFQSKDLYKVLGTGSSADEKQVKKAYYKKSLECHPDRAKEDEKQSATRKFQVLGKIYSILSDKEKRAAYDETGCVEDEDFVNEDRDWSDYFRVVFPKVTVEDIKKFEETYKGSEDEKEDLKSIYLSSQGDMDKILDSMLCSTIDDEPRYREIIMGMIKNKELEDFKKFSKETKKKQETRRKRYAAEAVEAEELAEELGLKRRKTDKGEDDTSDLAAMIQQRQSDRAKQMNGFFDQLEAKYGGDTKKKGAGGGKKGKGKKKA